MDTANHDTLQRQTYAIVRVLVLGLCGFFIWAAEHALSKASDDFPGGAPSRTADAFFSTQCAAIDFSDSSVINHTFDPARIVFYLATLRKPALSQRIDAKNHDQYKCVAILDCTSLNCGSERQYQA